MKSMPWLIYASRIEPRTITQTVMMIGSTDIVTKLSLSFLQMSEPDVRVILLLQ